MSTPARSLRSSLAHVATIAFVVLMLPFAPLLYARDAWRRRRARRMFAVFKRVVKVESATHAFALRFEDGSVHLVSRAALGSARALNWGDGVNGSHYEVGFALADRSLFARADGWRDTLTPVFTAIDATPEAWPHPDETPGLLLFAALIGLAIDLALVALFVWLVR